MKIIRVESCRGCPHYFTADDCSDWHGCGHFDFAGEEIPDPDTIPEWCPLEDAPTGLPSSFDFLKDEPEVYGDGEST